jgi:DNA-directed RNA polymerase subunit M/transcription elongation factor TFIIS
MTSPNDASLSFGCPQCLKRLRAPATLAGTQSRCPYCQMAIRVPLHSHPSGKGEEYPLHQESDSMLIEEACVLVVCPVCHARMHPPESAIGKKVTCPDCGTSTTVSPPAEEPAKKPRRTAEQVGDYPLANEVVREAHAVPAAEQSYVPVLCPVCHTRMLATEDQVGSRLTCPDCGSLAVVPPMPKPRKKIDVMEGAGKGYGLIDYDESRPQATAPQPSVYPDPTDEPPEIERWAPRRERPVLPDRPFLDGTFSFPFSASVYPRTIQLTVFSIVFSAIGCAAAAMFLSRDPVALFACAMLGGFAAILVLMWFIILSATVLTVLNDTAAGADAIEDWPDAVFLDWMGDSLWIFCALCMSTAPGAAISWLLEMVRIPCGVTLLPVSMFLCFPFVLLSMLEHNWIFGIFSVPVWRTLFVATSGWLRFYVTSALLFAVTSIFDTIAAHINPIAGFCIVSVTQSAAWLIYFRLLGRLAWYCSDKTAKANFDAELDDIIDDDDIDEELVSEDTSP